jgi:hypothetical protein
MYFGSKLKLFQVFQVESGTSENENFEMRWARNGGNEREMAMMGCMSWLGTKSTNWALWAWWIWCQTTTAAVESHRVKAGCPERRPHSKIDFNFFHRFGCSRCNLERGTILIWNKNNNANPTWLWLFPILNLNTA